MGNQTGDLPRVVVLDATVLVGDRGFVGADAQALLIECRAGRRRVIVPEVALIEAVARHRRVVAEAVDAVDSAVRRLHRLAGHPLLAVSGDAAPQAEAEAYESVLRARFLDYSVTVAPLPEVAHAELVRMAVERRRPFQEAGTGYRDALIWATVRDLAQDEPVAFITNNSRDFGAGRAGAATVLHPDLAADVPSASVRIWPTLAALVADLGSPDAELVDTLEADFDTGGPVWLALARRFAAETDGMDFGAAVHVEPAYPVLEALVLAVFDVHGITLNSVTAVDPAGSVLIEAVVNADVEIQVTVLEQHLEVRSGEGPVTVAVPLRCFGALWFEVSAVLEPETATLAHVTVNPDVASGMIDLSDYSPPSLAFS